MTVAEYDDRGEIAVITLTHAPVNALGIEIRAAIADYLERATTAEAIRATIITGSGNFFSGGADVAEFDSPLMTAAPSLADLLKLIEQAHKPILAAINGFALGGGLELALACHYRLALRTALLGLPEVKLGLLPGAGGTQRLPRLIGVERSLNMILSGQSAAASGFEGLPLLDGLADSDVLGATVEFARRLIADSPPLKRVRDIKIELENAEAFFDFARFTNAASTGEHHPAPRKIIDAVEAAVLRPFEEGLQIEGNLFSELLRTSTSKALRHSFFATRAASKIPDVPSGTPLRNIHSIGVIGAGTMGGGIAMNFANVGIPVTVLETSQAALDKGLGVVRKNYENTRKKGRLSAMDAEQRLGNITGTLSYEDLRSADLVIEAVFEDMSVKQQVFETLDRIAKPGAILASNTSTLDIDRIAGFTQRPHDVVGLHFFSPANVSQLLEIVRGAKTGKDVLATSLRIAKTIQKTGVVAGVCDGFIGNRMLNAYFRQMDLLLDVGAMPQQIDRALEQFGFAMGPFRVSDLAGNDISWAIRKRLYVEYPNRVYSRIPDRICELGRFGQKTNAGFYDYKAGDRTPHPSSIVSAIVEEEAARIGKTRNISNDEIVERALYALINEGARILEDGIALRGSDIDVVYIAGYGFPNFRGGPLFYADTVGLPNILRAMRRFRRGYQSDAWEPAPLLVALAQENGRLSGWRAKS